MEERVRTKRNFIKENRNKKESHDQNVLKSNESRIKQTSKRFKGILKNAEMSKK